MAFSKTVSLWDLMQKLDGRRILEGLAWLSNLHSKWTSNLEPQRFDDDQFEVRRDQLERLVIALREADLPVSAGNAESLLKYFLEAAHDSGGRVFSGISREGVVHFADKLVSVAPDEAGIRRFLLVAPENVRLYEGESAPFGDEVESVFPIAIDDIRSAGRCLALG